MTAQAVFEVIDAMPDAYFAALLLASGAVFMLAVFLAQWLARGCGDG